MNFLEKTNKHIKKYALKLHFKYYRTIFIQEQNQNREICQQVHGYNIPVA